jgi:serine/threonine protein kinase/tetratricopeptide (TPR) repeat protein
MTATPSNITGVGLQIGDKLDKYEIVSQIGTGGFSVVWKGVDRLLNQSVAVKQITVDPGADAEAFRDRFRSEADTQKKLARSNKHIVDIIEFIEDPRGMFIIMEFVDGQSLEQLLQQQPGPMDPATALGIAAATAVALGAVHKQGVIHRDLKPANILLPKEGGLKICDFGLATLVEQATPSLGTVRYMAPELLNAQPADGRADIYSLGLILYECLVGRDGFNDAFKVVLRDQRNQALRWMKWHTNLKVKAPAIKQYNPAVPEPIEELIARMMEKDARQRVGTCELLLEAMKRQLLGAQAGQPNTPAAHNTDANPAALGDATTALPRRNKLLYIGIGTLVVWLTIGIIYMAMEKSKKTEEVDLQKQVVLDDYHYAYSAFEQLVISKNLNTIEWTSYDDKGKKIEENTKHLDEQPMDWATMVTMLRALTKEENYREQTVRVGKHGGPLGLSSATRLKFAKAMVAFNDSQFDEATSLLEEADNLAAKIKPPVMNRTLIGDTQDNVTRAQSVDLAEKEINDIVARNTPTAFRLAAHKYQKFRTTSEKNMTAAQRDRWDTLGQAIGARQATQEVRRVLDTASALAANDRPGAISLLEVWIEDNTTNISKQHVAEYLGKLKNQDMFERAMADGRAAEVRGDMEVAIEKYNLALSLNIAQAKAGSADKQIPYLRGEMAFNQGKAAFEAGNTTVAVAKLREALSYNPGKVEATEILKSISSSAQLEQVKTLAIQAFDNKEYAKSINLWKQLRDDFSYDASEVTTRIAKAEFLIAVDNMEKAWAGSESDQALLGYIDKVLQMNPDYARASKIKLLIDTRNTYRAQLASGDSAKEGGEYGNSKLKYRRARQIAETIDDLTIKDQLIREATTRLDEVEYIDAITKARRDFKLEKLKTAFAWASTAYRTKRTDESKALRDKIKAILDKQETKDDE